jgi:hypothetical protein
MGRGARAAAQPKPAGLTEAALPAGAAVTAWGHRHLDPNRLEMKTERLAAGTTVFDIYPDRS